MKILLIVLFMAPRLVMSSSPLAIGEPVFLSRIPSVHLFKVVSRDLKPEPKHRCECVVILVSHLKKLF